MYPESYRYSEEHEWVAVDEAGDVATVGITHFAQEELGEVVFVELPEVGDVCEQGGEIGNLESVKAVADVYAPLAGEVVGVNETLEDEPERVNSSPHDEGWLVKIKIADAGQLDGLMDAAAYEAFTKAQDN